MYLVLASLTLFCQGGGALVPWGFNIYNFLKIYSNAIKFRDVSLNVSGNNFIWHFVDHVTWCFHGNNIYVPLNKKKRLSV